VADAVKATNATTSAAIIAQLNTVKNYPGMFGHYSFSPQDHNGYPDTEVVMSTANTFRDGAFMIATVLLARIIHQG
jgi:branched-chain amino acid transport system substrate-binding protein